MKVFDAQIYHKRVSPKENRFLYSGLYIQLDIDNYVDCKRPLLSYEKFNLLSFYKKDHGYRDGSSLRKWALEQLKTVGLENFDGKIILQTFPRYLGFVFNPVSFWFCYDGEKLVAVIAEVNNTFGESYNYVVKISDKNRSSILKKNFYVSPFFHVDGKYSFNFSKGNKVSIDYFVENELRLITSIQGEEVEWSNLKIISLLLKNPFFTLMIVFLIHYQALRLFLKGNKYIPNPKRRNIEIESEVKYE